MEKYDIEFKIEGLTKEKYEEIIATIKEMGAKAKVTTLPIEPAELGEQERYIRLSGALYLKFHEEYNLSLDDCDNISEFTKECFQSLPQSQTESAEDVNTFIFNHRHNVYLRFNRTEPDKLKMLSDMLQEYAQSHQISHEANSKIEIEPKTNLQKEFGRDFINTEGYFSTSYVEWLEEKIVSQEAIPTDEDIEKWAESIVGYLRGTSCSEPTIDHQKALLIKGAKAMRDGLIPTITDEV